MNYQSDSTAHHVGFELVVYDNESGPLVKLFNRAMAESSIIEAFNAEELDRLETFIECFKDLALDKGD